MAMTIEIKKLELEVLIAERLRSGSFENVEDVLLQALKSSPPQNQASPPEQQKRKQTLSEFLMDSPLAGSELYLERDKDPGRSIQL